MTIQKFALGFFKGFSVLIFLAWGLIDFGFESAYSYENFLPINGGQLGAGFNTKTLGYRFLKPLQLSEEDKYCVNGNIRRQRIGLSPSQISRRMFRADSVMEMSQHLQLPPGAFFNMGAYSKDLRVRYLNQTSFSELSTLLAIHVRILAEEQYLEKVELDRKAFVALTQQGPEAFLRSCGDQFVLRKWLGYEKYALIEFVSPTREAKASLDEEIKRGITLFENSGQFSADLLRISNEISASDTGAMRGFVIEGTRQRPLPALEGVAQYFASFYNLAVSGQERVSDLGFQSVPYSAIRSMPKKSVLRPKTWFYHPPVRQDEQLYFKKLLEIFEESRRYQEVLSNIVSNNYEYFNVNFDLITLTDERISRLRERILDHVRRCTERTAMSCRFAEDEFVIPKVALPVRMNPEEKKFVESVYSALKEVPKVDQLRGYVATLGGLSGQAGRKKVIRSILYKSGKMSYLKFLSKYYSSVDLSANEDWRNHFGKSLQFFLWRDAVLEIFTEVESKKYGILSCYEKLLGERLTQDGRDDSRSVPRESREKLLNLAVADPRIALTLGKNIAEFYLKGRLSDDDAQAWGRRFQMESFSDVLVEFLERYLTNSAGLMSLDRLTVLPDRSSLRSNGLGSRRNETFLGKYELTLSEHGGPCVEREDSVAALLEDITEARDMGRFSVQSGDSLDSDDSYPDLSRGADEWSGRKIWRDDLSNQGAYISDHGSLSALDRRGPHTPDQEEFLSDLDDRSNYSTEL